MNEEEIFEKLEGLTADYVTISQETLQGLLDLYKQEKEKSKELESELDRAIELLNRCNKRLESISRELGITNEDTYGYVYEEIIEEIKQIKEDECTATKCQIITQNYIRKDKIRKILEKCFDDMTNHSNSFNCGDMQMLENNILELLEEQ